MAPESLSLARRLGPALTLQEALEHGYTRLTLVNANGMVFINVGLNYRQALSAAPATDYQLSLSAVPGQNLVCDVSGMDGTPDGPCHLTLMLQFPTFERQVSLLKPSMNWIVSAPRTWVAYHFNEANDFTSLGRMPLDPPARFTPWCSC